MVTTGGSSSSIVMVIVAEPGLPKESTTEAVIMWVLTYSVDISKDYHQLQEDRYIR